MKVLMTSDCIGGVWTYTLELARGLTAIGHDVVVAVMGGELTVEQTAELDAAGLHRWEARPYKLEWMPQADRDLREAEQWLLELAAAHACDLVHLNQFNFASLPWDVPAIVVAHSDVVSWWRAVHGAEPPAQWHPYRRRVLEGIASADLVVAPTHAVLRDLRRSYDVDPPSTVIYNGRTHPGVSPGARHLLAAAGRVDDEGKNLATAVRAAQGLPWPLAVAGSGPQHGPQFRGRLSGASFTALLAEATIFIEPARYEPFGLAALEAGLVGCALVLGDIPSLREVWGDSATFVDPDDDDAVRAAVRSLIDDPQLLQSRQLAAQEQAAIYDVERMTAAYSAVYQSLLPAVGSAVAT